MKNLIGLCIMIPLAVLVSCQGNSSVKERLARAETLMCESPDSALILLQGTDAGKIIGR